jgi:4-amino-4-deoxy-L-arabinose transferase-like glycosyltransferase
MMIRREQTATIPLAIMVFVLAIGIVLVFWRVLPEQYRANESSDYLSFYEPVGRNLAFGRGFVLDDGRIGTTYPPGYPLVIAAAYRISAVLHTSYTDTMNMLVLLSVGISSSCIFGMAQMLGGNRAGVIAAMLWTTYPVFLWSTKQYNSEIAFIVCFYLANVLLWHCLKYGLASWWRVLSIGVLVGCSILIRPIAIGIFLPMAFLILARFGWLSPMQRWLRLVLVLAGMLLVLMPWEIWLYQQTGRFIFLSSNGPSSIRDGLTFALNTNGYRNDIHVPDSVQHLMQQLFVRWPEMRTLGGIAVVLGQAFQTDPWAVVQLLLLKAARAWYGTDSGRLEREILIVQVCYLGLGLCAGVAAWRGNRFSRDAVIYIGLMVLYFWAITTLVLPILRYMLPVFGLVFVLVPKLVRGRTRLAIDNQ